MTKIYLDTEFYEDGRHIDLISIGMVSETGHEFYREAGWFDWNRVPIDHWIRENVQPHLLGDEAVALSPDELRYDVLAFVNGVSGLRRPEFWAYFAAYDWVVLCQLFGTMVELPDGWPLHCLDLQQCLYERDLKKHDMPHRLTVEREDAHHALADAKWNQDLHAWIATA